MEIFRGGDRYNDREGGDRGYGGGRGGTVILSIFILAKFQARQKVLKKLNLL